MSADHYAALGVEPGATVQEIETAYEEQLELRRAKRKKNGDLHQAIAVLGDPMLRRTYDLKRTGTALSLRLSDTKDAAADVIADIDVVEVARQTRQTALKGIVLVSGVTAKVGDMTALVSRKVQVAAARRLQVDQSDES